METEGKWYFCPRCKEDYLLNKSSTVKCPICDTLLYYSWVDKCRTCKHTYTRDTDDLMHCELPDSRCEYEPY